MGVAAAAYAALPRPETAMRPVVPARVFMKDRRVQVIYRNVYPAIFGSMVPPTGGRRERLALHLVQLGLVLVVLIALPYKTFDLDRFFVPKELVLHATAVIAALLCLGGRRRLELSFTDLCIAGFLGLSLVSSVLAQNWWLAGRAVAISISGALLFWVGTTLRAAGLQRQI